jgi:hypothetical protein
LNWSTLLGDDPPALLHQGRLPLKKSALRAGLVLVVGLAFGLAACLSSDAPDLSPKDLTEPAQFGGAYIASAFPEESADQPDVDATVEPLGDRSYRLTFSEGERKDAPAILRLLTLNDKRLLGVVTDPDPAKGAIYVMVSRVSNGGWVFRNLGFKEEARNRTLREALQRHGATAVEYGEGSLRHDRIQGRLTAANLRAMFSDADVLPALETDGGFRLSPKFPETSGTELD